MSLQIPSFATSVFKTNPICQLSNLFKSNVINIRSKSFNCLVDEDEQDFGLRKMYQDHIPTTKFQSLLLAAGSAVTVFQDPSRDDMLCAFGETTGYAALKSLYRKMSQCHQGRLILKARPVINSGTVDVDYLSKLPDGSFGKSYWCFLSKHGFSPDARLPVQFVDDPELMYVMLRYRQIHDLTHTLLGMPANMLGEVVVKWVEAIQTGLPMCVAAALFGPLRLGPKHRRKYLDTYLAWAVRCGKEGQLLMNVYFEKCWERDMDDLRQELNIQPPPTPLTQPT